MKNPPEDEGPRQKLISLKTKTRTRTTENYTLSLKLSIPGVSAKLKEVVREKTLVFTSLVHRVNIKLNFPKFSGQKPLNSGGEGGRERERERTGD